MLNEAYEIHQSLCNARISPELQHPDITTTLGKGTYFQVCLDASGGIALVRSCDDEFRQGLWTHQVGNGLWFPVVPVEIALLDVPADDPIRAALNEKTPSAEVCQMLCNSYLPSEFTKKEKKKLLDRLEQGQKIRLASPQMEQLVSYFEQSLSNDLFLSMLREQAIKNLLRGVGDMRAWVALILGAKVRLALDLNESIYCSTTRRRVVQALLDAERGDSKSIGVCSLTGKSGALQTGPFPKVPLSTLGKEYPLFSRFYASECNARYGKIGSESLPVSRETALQMKDAMTWLLDEQRRGKTWCAVASGRMDGKREKQDLLLAYVIGRPELDARTAEFLAGRNDEEEADEENPPSETEALKMRFEADTANLCKRLSTEVNQPPLSRMQICLLRKASDGAAFVAMSETPTVQDLIDGSQWWVVQGYNLPRFTLPIIPAVKGARLQRVAPGPIPIGRVVTLFTREWRRGGTEYTPIGGVTLGEVLPLLLYPERREAVAAELLGLLLPRVTPLMVGIGGVIHRREDADWNKFGNQARRFALRTLGFLGICLSAQGREKGTYMNESAYQIGQMLALADRLHRDYHIVVRSGAMPPMLIGNSHFSMALENPIKALSVLASRMPVYLGWAKTVQASEAASETIKIAVSEARKVLREYQTLAAAVHGSVTEKMTDKDKAEMLLGYLAGVGKQEKDEEENK